MSSMSGVFLSLVITLALATSTAAFAPGSSLVARSLRTSATCSLRMQTNPKGDGDREYPSFDPDMQLLNQRISKLKERESNPLNRISDSVNDNAEQLQRDAKKLANNVPVPDIRTVNLPKWALPLGAIIALSIITTLLQTRETFNSVELATGSL